MVKSVDDFVKKIQNTQLVDDNGQKPILMSDEFSKKDLYARVNQKYSIMQTKGRSLKHIELAAKYARKDETNMVCL